MRSGRAAPAREPRKADAGLIEPNITGSEQDEVPTFSADGARLIFRSRDQLVDEDVNDRIDVYDYAEGKVHLLSGGPALKDQSAQHQRRRDDGDVLDL